ncbi:MAG: hypothetical protein KDG89_12645 [Geminicoccaceae bacterium]|nr:hypothetical protein [Geminicoccaceae bacterium]
MTLATITKTSFTSGEIDPALYGRLDLRAYGEGAARLRNVVVQTTGGVRRRAGTGVVRELPGVLRLLPFDEGEADIVLALGDRTLTVLVDGVPVQAPIASPWAAAQVGDLDWTRIGDRLLLCHGEVEPQILGCDMVGQWALWRAQFATGEADGVVRSLQPFARYAAEDVAIQAVHPDFAAEAPIPAFRDGQAVFVELVTSAPFFTAAHYGVRLRLKGREVVLTNLRTTSSGQVNGIARVVQDLVDGKTTRRWEEQAFSAARGWPVAVTQHQERLVLGGSRDLPDQIWFSKVGDPFNFDTGTGLDDEAVVFRLRGDRFHRIRHLLSDRRLQVFTTTGEWVVSGSPLGPTNVSVEPQTQVGSPEGRQVRPLSVDGATLFVGRSGRDLREFLFTDTEQAFQASDIALLSRHLMVDPVEMAFDSPRRVLTIVRGDGHLVTVTLDRNSNVAGWSLQEVKGAVLSIAMRGRRRYLLVRRFGKTFLEAWDEAEAQDHVRTLTATVPTKGWTGFDYLEGQRLRAVFADGTTEDGVVEGGTLRLTRAATSLHVGLPFAHEVVPLPPVFGSGQGGQNGLYRPVRIVFRLLNSRKLRADTGEGLREMALPGGGQPFTGDVGTRAIGWRRGLEQPPWRVSQDDALPFELLSVSLELKVNA